MKSYSPKLRAAAGFPKMLADLALHSKRHGNKQTKIGKKTTTTTILFCQIK